MKNVRRLIPAFALLLVTAIMLSTASFAWFTMNDEVTATGMQVQAKASGNLLISKDKMTATSSSISVDFGGTKQNLIPITYVEADSAWYDAADVDVDPIYGIADGALNPVTVGAEADDHFSEYVVYLATAGQEPVVGNLKFDLEALVNADATIAPAYTVALYVAADGQAKDTIDWTQPTATFNQLTNKTTEGWVDTGVEVTVPSTYGKVAETAVGLMVVIRVYVDGGLEIDGGVSVPAKNNIKLVADLSDAKYTPATMSGWTFYTDEAGTAVYDKALLQDGQDLSTVVKSYWDGSTTPQPNAPATYVNNTSVPAAGTSFSIDFRVGG